MDYDLIVVKTLERVYKNYYYIIRGIIKDDLQMTEQNNFKIVKNFMVEEGGE